MESALAWYGFIPEIVYAYTSVTARITRTFENACGRSCYIRFPEILHQSGLTPDAERKILIRIDSEAKEKLYEPKKVFLNKFTILNHLK